MDTFEKEAAELRKMLRRGGAKKERPVGPSSLARPMFALPPALRKPRKAKKALPAPVMRALPAKRKPAARKAATPAKRTISVEQLAKMKAGRERAARAKAKAAKGKK